MSKIRKYYSFWLRVPVQLMLLTGYIFGALAIYQLLYYNMPRGDEYFSFAEAYSCGLWQLLSDIKHGMDVSYTYAALLWAAFKIFGHTIYVQRGLSFVIGLAAILKLYRWAVQYVKNSLGAWFFIACIALSNLAYFLLSDGRFYSLLFYFSVSLFVYIAGRLEKSKKFSLLTLFFIQEFALLTSMNFLVLQVVMAFSLLLMTITDRESYSRYFSKFCLSAVISIGIYYFFFRINYFYSFQVSALLSERSQPVYYILSDILQNMARWIAIPSFPHVADVYGMIVFWSVLIILIPFVISSKTPNDRMGHSYRWLMSVVVSLFCFLAGMIGLELVRGGYVWVPRYYTPVFFLAGLIIIFWVKAWKHFTWMAFLAFFFSVGIAYNAYGYYKKYKAKEEIKHELDAFAYRLIMNPAKIYVVQNVNGTYDEMQFYAALYCFYPELRPKMEFLYQDRDKDMVYFLHNLNSKRLLAHCEAFKEKPESVLRDGYVIARTDDQRFGNTAEAINNSNMKLIQPK